jgi:hypothetical protein
MRSALKKVKTTGGGKRRLPQFIIAGVPICSCLMMSIDLMTPAAVHTSGKKIFRKRGSAPILIQFFPGSLNLREPSGRTGG